jgi:hypothetical protein
MEPNAGWTICSTAELVGDCFTQCLVSFTTTFFNAQQPMSVIKCGLPGHGFIVVVPSCFHFTITSPAIQLGQPEKDCNIPDRFLADMATNN